MCPLSLIGVADGKTISWPSVSPGKLSRFSAIVFPVTVMQSPCRKPSASSCFSTAGLKRPTICDESTIERDTESDGLLAASRVFSRAADRVKVLHHVLPRRLEVGDERRSVGDPLRKSAPRYFKRTARGPSGATVFNSSVLHRLGRHVAIRGGRSTNCCQGYPRGMQHLHVAESQVDPGRAVAATEPR